MKMKNSLDIKLVKFYLWVGLGYATLWVASSHLTFPGTLIQSIGNNIWRVIYLIFLNYIFFEYTIPFVLRKRRFIFYNIILVILAFWLHCIFWAYGMYVWRSLGIGLHIYAGLTIYKSLGKAYEDQMAYSAGSIFFFGIIRHVYNYIKLKNMAQQLQIEKQAAELSYLKSQTNPHFLFNTLNNIYALARDKSDLAPESILKLSKILRFMLYETSGAYISVEQELKIIDDYISLEKLRYDQALRVNFIYNIEDMKQALPPLLLISLVENAFKHGTSETIEKQFVDLKISITKGILTFIVKNSSEGSSDQTVKENIGLSNLRRQLILLYKEHDLSINHSLSVFTATLRINLASHV